MIDHRINHVPRTQSLSYIQHHLYTRICTNNTESTSETSPKPTNMRDREPERRLGTRKQALAKVSDIKEGRGYKQQCFGLEKNDGEFCARRK